MIRWIIISSILVSCSPQKRAQIALERALKLDSSIMQSDTIVLRDTIYYPEIYTDTIVGLSQNDTIFLEKDRLKVKVLIDTISNTVYVEGECQSDTIYQDKIVIKERYVQKQDWQGWVKEKTGIPRSIQWILIILSIIIVAYTFIRRL